MKKKMIIGVATAAITAGAAITPGTATAGTGGGNGVGIIYGEGAHYCEVSALAIHKVDSETGANLDGAVFTVQAAPGVGVKATPYAQAAKINDVDLGYGQNPDKDVWQSTFNQAIDTAFTASPYGQLWQAASVIQPGDEPSRVDSDGAAGTVTGGGEASNTGTTFTPSGQIMYPVDITALTNSSAQAAQMEAWVGIGTDTSNGSWSVNDFSVAAKSRLDSLGVLLWTNYSAAAPTNPQVLLSGPILGATQQTQNHVANEYSRMRAIYAALQSAVTASGYPEAVFAADGAVTAGEFDAAAQDWAAFVAGYNTATTAANWSFGVNPPDYELIRTSVGAAAVQAANEAAHEAVGATYVGDGDDAGLLTLTTGDDGLVSYTVFGRLSERVDGALTNGDCSALVTTVTETVAPQGYHIADEPLVMAPGNVDTSGVETMIFVNDPARPAKPGPVPQTPTFESGI